MVDNYSQNIISVGSHYMYYFVKDQKLNLLYHRVDPGE